MLHQTDFKERGGKKKIVCSVVCRFNEWTNCNGTH